MPRVDHYETGTPCWIDLSTPDPDGAVTFYTTVFGWDHEPMPAATGGTYHMFTQGGAAVAGCMRQPPELADAGVPPAWTTYLAGDPDKVAESTPSAGGQVLTPPFDVGRSGRMAMITDPSGAAFGVWAANEHIGSELVNEPVSVTWNELNTSDMEASARFLEEVFDVGTDDLPSVESGYRLVKVGGVERAGILQMTDEWEGVPPHWTVYFAVPDTDAACAAIVEAGGAVSVQPFDSEFGRMAVVNDPHGAVFMVASQKQE